MSDVIRILLVEDDALIAMDFEDELIDNGFKVRTVSTLARAREALAEEVPNLAILDMNLRNEPTFALAEELRAIEVPYFFVSGNDKSALPPGLADSLILTKPVRMSDVVAEVRRLVPTQG